MNEVSDKNASLAPPTRSLNSYAELIGDPAAMYSALSAVLYLAEEFNAQCWRRIRTRGAASLSTDSELKRLLLWFCHRYTSKPFGSQRTSESSASLEKFKLPETVNLQLVEDAVGIILAPGKLCRVDASDFPRSRMWRIDGMPNLPRARDPVHMQTSVHAYDLHGYLDFSTGPISSRSPVFVGMAGSGRLWDEVLDPIAVCSSFLTRLCAVRTSSADHFLQSWIRHQFSLRYETWLKHTFKDICGALNSAFYGTEFPRSSDTRNTRPRTLGLATMLSVISETVAAGARETHQAWADDQQQADRMAFGVYLFLRSARIARVRYHTFNPTSWLLKSAGETALDDRDEKLRSHASWARQCVTLMRPVDYTYFQTKVFGAVSGIPGFNAIWRGGLLPHPDRGRVFVVHGRPGSGKSALALQLMADMAYRGRFSAFLSFEESRTAIYDRLIGMGLTDPRRFAIVQPAPSRRGDDLLRQVETVARANPRRGILVLYGQDDWAQIGFDVGEALEVLSNVARSGAWKWYGTAIDSLNALRVDKSGTLLQQLPIGSQRHVLQKLVSISESRRIWTVAVSEAGPSDLDLLGYVADSVIELGVDGDGIRRWLQIHKCRAQDFHAGRHTLRISGRGLRIFPSLLAVGSTLRKRTRSTLSEERVVVVAPSAEGPVETNNAEAAAFPSGLLLPEKSLSVICSPQTSLTRRLLMNAAVAPVLELSLSVSTKSTSLSRPRDLFRPRNVMYCTFRTSEVELRQELRSSRTLERAWSRLRRGRMRCFSSGYNLLPEQIIEELIGVIRQNKIDGLPLERLIFDEAEAIDSLLLSVAREPLFWPTIAELAKTEAITCIIGYTGKYAKKGCVENIVPIADYAIRATRWTESPNVCDLKFARAPGINRLSQGPLRIRLL